MSTIMLSVLVPVYNEEDCVTLLYNRLAQVLDKLPCESEILFVNDGSNDNTLRIVQKLQQNDKRIAYLDLSRNFGKEVAMYAGIDYIKGDTLVILDADLQHPPELIPQMLAEIENGFDDVYTSHTARKEGTWLRKWMSKKYYCYLKKLSNVPILENTGDFRMFSKKAIIALRDLKENERNMKGLFSYIGFKKKALLYEQSPRVAGNTKWNYTRLLDLAIKGLTSFSVLPLRIVSIIGCLVSLIAFVYLVTVIINFIFFDNTIGEYQSIMCVVLFIGGFILLALGVIGEYLGIIYNETKKRPVYFINEYCSS